VSTEEIAQGEYNYEQDCELTSETMGLDAAHFDDDGRLCFDVVRSTFSPALLAHGVSFQPDFLRRSLAGLCNAALSSPHCVQRGSRVLVCPVMRSYRHSGETHHVHVVGLEQAESRFSVSGLFCEVPGLSHVSSSLPIGLV
jgi:hypothetical protein